MEDATASDSALSRSRTWCWEATGKRLGQQGARGHRESGQHDQGLYRDGGTAEGQQVGRVDRGAQHQARQHHGDRCLTGHDGLDGEHREEPQHDDGQRPAQNVDEHADGVPPRRTGTTSLIPGGRCLPALALLLGGDVGGPGEVRASTKRGGAAVRCAAEETAQSIDGE